jgi:ADP-heptose:LPS heptosyltransferase
MTQSHRLLLCLRYGIGDVVMEMPALRGLRAAMPHTEIYLLGARPALELFEGDPDFQALICIQDFGFSHWGDLGDAEARQRFQQWFSNAGFSGVLDPFHAVFGVQNTLTQSGVPWRNCSPVPQPPEELTGGHGIAAIWESAVENWGLASLSAENRGHLDPPAPALYIPDRVRRCAEDRIAQWLPRDDRAIVGMAPIASSELKRWPLERILEVIRWLVGERNRRILIFGMDETETAFARQLREQGSKSDIALVQPTHLQETAALITRCQAFLSNDTGLMHLAACVDVPTIGIFGPTAAHLYLPDNSLAVASNRPCEYRLYEEFGPPRCVHEGHCLIAEQGCIHDIPVEAAKLALDKLLSAQTGPAAIGWQFAAPSSGNGSSLRLES